MKTDVKPTENTAEYGNKSKPLLADVASGDKVVFSEEFKKEILALEIEDWLFYIKDRVFEVKEVLDGKISIKGLHCLGFRTFSHFNIC